MLQPPDPAFQELDPDVVPRRRWIVRNGAQPTTNASVASNNNTSGAAQGRDTSTRREPSHDEPQAPRRPRNTGRPTMARLAQTTAALQAQLAQVQGTMSGLATTLVERQVQAFNTPIALPAPALEPPRIPLQAQVQGTMSGLTTTLVERQVQAFNTPITLPAAAPALEPPRIPVPPSSLAFTTRPPSNRSQQLNPRTAGAPKGVPYGYSVLRF
jgi:hypothetical protein